MLKYIVILAESGRGKRNNNEIYGIYRIGGGGAVITFHHQCHHYIHKWLCH